MVSPSLSFLNTVFKTHNLNSKPITHNSKPTITQKLQNFCLLTKPSHISQLLSPSFAKMVEPTDQSFSTVFFPYLHDSTWRTWNPHPNPVSSPPPTTNPDSTTINTTNSHTKNPKECTGNPQPNLTSPKKKKKNAKKKKKLKQKNGAPTWNNETTAFAASATVVVVATNTKCKLMSSAKLPISRSMCLIIPPGLSQTSFLKSPALLSNMKVWSCSLSLMPHKKSKRMHS